MQPPGARSVVSAAPTPPRLTVEQILRKAQVTSYTEELDLTGAADLTTDILQVLCECMPGLKRLSVHGTGLREVPDSVCRLRELRELNLSNNQLTSLPSSIVLLGALQHLNIAKNILSELPAAFGMMPVLRLLNANNNRLVRLPDSFGQLAQLRVLRLGANLLDALPATFGSLGGLRLLQLGHNSFRQFPVVLSKLDRLSVLDVSFNQLAALPEYLRNMTSLATLNVTGNELKQVPTALALPQELRITGMFSLLSDGSVAPENARDSMVVKRSDLKPLMAPAETPAASRQGLYPSERRPDFNGPQGQLDVTGIFLAGLLPGGNDTDTEATEPRGKKR